MRTNREQFLRNLESVQPGLSAREFLEQSSCFAFGKGMVMTFNDEVACRASSGLDKSIKGAVKAKPVLLHLAKLKEELIDVTVVEDKLVITGKNKVARFAMEMDVVLAVDSVENPSEWKPLPDSFVDAVRSVETCAGKNESEAFTCIHIHPKFIEASDNVQIARYRIKTGVAESILIRRDSLRHIVSLDISEMSVGEAWVHFRGSSGLALSCRRYLETFPDLTPALKIEGEAATLPKSLGEEADLAGDFADEGDDKQILVELRNGRVRITGAGVIGDYQGRRKLKYSGPPLSFFVHPRLLTDLCKNHNDCIISKDRLKVGGEKYTYAVCLVEADETPVNGKVTKEEESDNE